MYRTSTCFSIKSLDIFCGGRISAAGLCARWQCFISKGLFTRNVSIAVFVKITVKIPLYVNGNWHFDGQNVLPLILTIKVSSEKIKGAAHKSADFDSTCKRGLSLETIVGRNYHPRVSVVSGTWEGGTLPLDGEWFFKAETFYLCLKWIFWAKAMPDVVFTRWHRLTLSNGAVK